MINKTPDFQKILQYWRAFESFEMPKIDVKINNRKAEEHPNEFPKTIEKNTKNNSLQWPLKTDLVDLEKQTTTTIFNVYFGIVEKSIIVHKIKEILNSKEYFDLGRKNELTCLGAVSINRQGNIIKNTYVTPDFVVALNALREGILHNNWGKAIASSKLQIRELTNPFCSRFESTHKNSPRVTIHDIISHAKSLSNLVHINDSKLRYFAVSNFKRVKGFGFDLVEKILRQKPPQKERSVDEDLSLILPKSKLMPNLINSFYLNDLSLLVKTSKDDSDEEAFGNSFCQYMGAPLSANERIDLNENMDFLEKIFSPEKIPMSRWPSKNDFPLVLAQQAAINLTFSEKSGLFSVNGPPGTGKTTLLRDIVSNVVVQRAVELSQFHNPKDAFSERLDSNDNGFKYVSRKIDKNLIGFEMILATANNAAAENISKELPNKKEIDEKWNANYFSELATYCFEERCWGIISAPLGNKSNTNNFFSKFWNKNDSRSLRYLLEKADFDVNKFEEYIERKCEDTEIEFYKQAKKAIKDFDISKFEEYIKKNKYGKEKEKRYEKIKNDCIQERLSIQDNHSKEEWYKEVEKFKKLLDQHQALQKNLTSASKNLKIISTENAALKEEESFLKQESKKKKMLQNDILHFRSEREKINKNLLKHRTDIANFHQLKELYNSLHNCKSYIDEKKDELSKQNLEESKNNEKTVENQAMLDDKNDYFETTQNLIKNHKQNKPSDWWIKFLPFFSKELKKWRLTLNSLNHKLEGISDQQFKHREEITNNKLRSNEISEKIHSLNKKIKVESLRRDDFQEKIEKYHFDNSCYNGTFESVIEGIKEVNCAIENNEKELSEVESKINNTQKELKDISFIIKESNERITTHQNNVSKASDQVQKVKILFKGKFEKNFPSKEFWHLPREVLQKLSPWVFDEIHSLKAQLFLSALRLHELFILCAREPMKNNLMVFDRLIKQNQPCGHEKNYRSIWASFFIAVPVISSTFSSFSKLFNTLGKEEIGYLLIDEASQVVPHHAIGAIWRSERVIAVGDPLQIQPIVTLPKDLSTRLREIYEVDSLYDLRDYSLQDFSDRVNPIGADLRGRWVGAPLIVHRRCDDPMFSISNHIAYGGLMINDVPQRTSPIKEKCFKQNFWFDVELFSSNFDSDSHWIEEEGRVAFSIYEKIASHIPDRISSVYTISPFKSVSEQFKDCIRKQWKDRRICENIGTVHTFQGKESELVILLLGGNKNKYAAIEWAAEEPNLLNVAVTRARSLLFVIGNHNLWSRQNYFNVLAASLPVIRDTNSLPVV